MFIRAELKDMINSKSFLFHLVELCDKFVGLMKAPTSEKKKKGLSKINQMRQKQTNADQVKQLQARGHISSGKEKLHLTAGGSGKPHGNPKCPRLRVMSEDSYKSA